MPADDLVPSLLAASDVLGTGWFGAVAAEAGARHFMTHLSLTEGDTAWGEHVTNTEYHSGGTGEAVAPATAGPEQPQ